jgi:putative flavoprotein involved in K+ transport
MIETIETVIVGGGQAGLCLSYYLSQVGREHIVLEKGSQPADAWRNHRWDSFCLVTPNWTFRLPGAEYQGDSPEGFMPREEVVATFERYVAQNRLPVQFQTAVTRVAPDSQDGAYLVTTGTRDLRAHNVVIATGLFQAPKIPAFAERIPAWVQQLSAEEYRRPETLPPGAVLVIGAGQSGCQIAEELYQSGRKVFMCASAAPRGPRRYRGHDIFHWLVVTGFMDQTPDRLPSPQARFGANPQASGKNGGHDINLHKFYRDGVILLGHLTDAQDGKIILAPDLQAILMKTDQAEKEFLTGVDTFIQKTGLDAPPETCVPLTDGYASPETLSLDLKKEGIQTIIWASGFRFDYSLVQLPVTDSVGFPITERGATRYPGLYFLGMPWLYKRKSGILFGVGEDAEHLARLIAGL